jgi:hypothetical protein
MKKGQKSSTDAEFFAQMKRVLALYRFSPDKDVFRTFYTRALAKRMLLERSASTDFEKEVLKFLSECALHFLANAIIVAHVSRYSIRCGVHGLHANV